MLATAPGVDGGFGITGPPGFDLRGRLAVLNDDALRDRSGAYRRDICRTDPVMFALVYLPHLLGSDETDRQVSLSEFHVKVARSARRLVRDDLGPAELREGWVTFRGGGKTTWLQLIIPCWAMAYRHRTFLVAFSVSRQRAAENLDNLREQWKSNELLRHDFPKLCAPKRRDGRAVADTKDTYQADNCTTFMARGMGQGTLGLNRGGVRPNWILLDDCEPVEKYYSPTLKADLLATIRQGVLAMNDRAAVYLTGTTTMYGSCTHDLVRHKLNTGTAKWITETKFKSLYYPAIMADDAGVERSSWPQRKPLAELQAERAMNTRDFALNMMNLPPSASGNYWVAEDFRYDPPDPRHVTERILWVDPAVSDKRTSDAHGIAMVAYCAGLRRVVVEYAAALRCGSDELREQVHRHLRREPTIRVVHVDVTNGGMYVGQALSPLPVTSGTKVRLEPVQFHESKASRFGRVHDFYRRKPSMVDHACALPALEDQLVAFPRGDHDDIADAACGAIDHFLADVPLTR